MTRATDPIRWTEHQAVFAWHSYFGKFRVGYNRSQLSARRRRAFTLSELLVVIAILAILAALLFPAIQMARESSRGSACRNNLKQVALSILSYESARNTFPKGAEGRYDRFLSPAPMTGLSWWVEVLPYLEEANVTDRLDRTGANTGWVLLNEHNGKIVDSFMTPIFFCPSSSVERFVRVGDFQVAVPTYTGISGASNYDGFSETRVSRCCRSEGQISGGGVLIPNAVIRTRQVSDGLAKTLLLGEQSDYAYMDGNLPQRIQSGFALGWLAGTDALGVPPNYGDWLSPSYNLTTIRYPLNENRYDLPGITNDVGANNPLIAAHGGIVNFAYCDGSVLPLVDSLDVSLLKSLATRNDEISASPQ